MADVFSEVDRELQEDRYKRLAFRVAPYLGVAVALLLIGVVAYQIVSANTQETRAAAAEQYSAALRDLENERPGAANATLSALAAEDAGAYGLFAQGIQAALLTEQGDREAAAAALRDQAAAWDEERYGDLQQLKALYLEFETRSRADLTLLARPLARDGRPYWAPARELIAAAALRDGALDDAKRDYEALKRALEAESVAQANLRLLQGLRERVDAALAVIAARQARSMPADDDTPPASTTSDVVVTESTTP